MLGSLLISLCSIKSVSFVKYLTSIEELSLAIIHLRIQID